MIIKNRQLLIVVLVIYVTPMKLMSQITFDSIDNCFELSKDSIRSITRLTFVERLDSLNYSAGACKNNSVYLKFNSFCVGDSGQVLLLDGVCKEFLNESRLSNVEIWTGVRDKYDNIRLYNRLSKLDNSLFNIAIVLDDLDGEAIYFVYRNYMPFEITVSTIYTY